MPGITYKKNNPYFMPRTLYRRVIAVIRDYPRQRQEVNDIIYGTTSPDVAVAGGKIGKPTEDMVIRLERYMRDLDAVEKALGKIPKEYQKDVFNNIVCGKRFPATAHYNTWLRWRKRFIWFVGKELNLV